MRGDKNAIDNRRTIQSIIDGSSNTILVGEKALRIPKHADTGANDNDHHLRGVNWARDCAEPQAADLRMVAEGDASPDGQGAIRFVRGIEGGHIFQLGRKYSEAMKASVQWASACSFWASWTYPATRASSATWWRAPRALTSPCWWCGARGERDRGERSPECGRRACGRSGLECRCHRPSRHRHRLPEGAGQLEDGRWHDHGKGSASVEVAPFDTLAAYVARTVAAHNHRSA